MDPLSGTCRFAASVSALKNHLYNHICWSNKGPCKFQQTCFCNINNPHKGLCSLINCLWEQSVLDTSEAGKRVLILHSVWNNKLIGAFYFTFPVNGLPIFFLLGLFPHFLKLVLTCPLFKFLCMFPS